MGDERENQSILITYAALSSIRLVLVLTHFVGENPEQARLKALRRSFSTLQLSQQTFTHLQPLDILERTHYLPMFSPLPCLHQVSQEEHPSGGDFLRARQGAGLISLPKVGLVYWNAKFFKPTRFWKLSEMLKHNAITTRAASASLFESCFHRMAVSQERTSIGICWRRAELFIGTRLNAVFMFSIS